MSLTCTVRVGVRVSVIGRGRRQNTKIPMYFLIAVNKTYPYEICYIYYKYRKCFLGIIVVFPLLSSEDDTLRRCVRSLSFIYWFATLRRPQDSSRMSISSS